MWFCFVLFFLFPFIYFDSRTLYIFVFFFFFFCSCCPFVLRFSVCRAYIIFAVVYSLMGRRGGWVFFFRILLYFFFLFFFYLNRASLEFTFRMWYTFRVFLRHSLKKKILFFQIYQLGIGQRRRIRRRTFFSGLTSHSMIRWVSGHWPAQYTEREKPSSE